MNCIINAAWGDGYVKGQNRMVESVRSVGFKGDILTWKNEEINEYHDVNYPYTMKAAAFWEAVSKGYQNILWLDCSIIAIKPLDELFELIDRDGFYFWKSGWNLAQSATDNDLLIGQISRDLAETLPECASGIVGLNMDDLRAQSILRLFLRYARAGVCSTSRNHDNQSTDPRFKFGRQDQTAFTMAFYNTSNFELWKMYDHNVYSAYWEKGKKYNESVCLLVKGI